MSRRLIPVLAVFALVAMPAAQTPLDRDAQRWVDATLKKMSLDQMVGQLIMPRFAGVYTSSDSGIFEELSRFVREAHVGGVIAFGGEEPVPQVLLNPTYGPIVLGQPLAVASMVNRLQAISALPLMTAADFEWGVGMRLAGATRFPRAMAFGAAGDDRLAFEAGRITALEGRALGVHVDFAPVADVNNNPRNPVINIRSFGENPARAGDMVSGFARGLQDAGMLAVLKHFPGHGDTDVDSHLDLPAVDHSRSRLDEIELRPFRAAIAAGVASVMTSHVLVREIDDARPATLSPPVIGGLLRKELGYTGVVVTDDLEMQALTKHWRPAQIAVLGAQAGCDLFEFCKSHDAQVEAIEALVRACEAGEVAFKEQEAAESRVRTLKERFLAGYLDPDPKQARLAAEDGRHRALAEEIALRSGIPA
jgi:beta-N-acetylhexosaminidase